VLLDPLVVPRQDRADRQFIQITFRSLLLPPLKHVSLLPVLVHEEH